MNPKTRALHIKAQEARGLLRAGKISMDAAKKIVEPYIQHVNTEIKANPDKYGRRKVNASSFLR